MGRRRASRVLGWRDAPGRSLFFEARPNSTIHGDNSINNRLCRFGVLSVVTFPDLAKSIIGGCLDTLPDTYTRRGLRFTKRGTGKKTED